LLGALIAWVFGCFACNRHLVTHAPALRCVVSFTQMQPCLWQQRFNSFFLFAVSRRFRLNLCMLAELLAVAQRIALDASSDAAAAASHATSHEQESGHAATTTSASMDQFRTAVQRIRFCDLGLPFNLEGLKRGCIGRPCVMFTDVLDHPALSISLITFPPGSSIPLHDHPGMHVYTKVLVGQLDVEMFDVDHPLPCSAVPVGTVVGVRNRRTVTLATGEFCDLTPVVGNIHGLACSGTDTAIMLDVSLAPYPTDDACHYFVAHDSSAQLCVIDESLAWGVGDASLATKASNTKMPSPASTKGRRGSGGGGRGSRRRV